MTIRHILVPLTGTKGEEHVAIGAMNLAKRLHAHVAVTNTVRSRSDVYDMTGLAIGPSQLEEIYNNIEAAQEFGRRQARHTFDAAMAETKLPMVNHPQCGQASAWYDDAVERDGDFSRPSRLTDLVVVNRPKGPGEVSQHEIVEDVLFGARRPVLLLPCRVGEIGQTVAVAWNGSLEAANALKAALSLLTSQATITLIQVGDLRIGGVSVEEAADYVGWHGHTAIVRKVEDKPKATTQIIVHETKTAGASLLVIGAYSHSRARESFLGGVTASILKDADIPVLMAH